MTDNKTEESLFSLEVYVDQIRIHESVTCSFPSVVLKVLDFEPVVITYYPLEFIQTLRQLSHYEVSMKVKELRTVDDSHIIKSGKSVLFRYEPRALASHLQRIPIYLLINDELPNPRKLLGVAPLSIHALSVQVVKDISKNGPLAPACHEKTGVFQIQSLMGQVIGIIGLKIRLTMIGPNILGHIPETLLSKAVVKSDCKVEKVEEHKEDPTKQNESDKMKEEPPAQQKVISVENKSLQTEGMETRPIKEEAKKGERKTHLIRMDNVSANPNQTNTSNSRFDESEYPTAVDESFDLSSYKVDASACQDLRIIDIEGISHVLSQPPPMFYLNGVTEPKGKENQRLVPFSHDMVVEEHLMKEDKKVTPGDPQDRKRMPRVPKKESGNVKRREHSASETQDLLRRNENLPLLNALLEELTVWKSREGSLIEQEKEKSQSSKAKESQKAVKYKKRTRLSERKEKTIPVTENRKEFLRRLSSPRTPRLPPEGIVPKSIGWLRSTPHFKGTQECNLKFGTTNTQKMRIAKQQETQRKESMQIPPSARRRMRKTYDIGGTQDHKVYRSQTCNNNAENIAMSTEPSTAVDYHSTTNDHALKRQDTLDQDFEDGHLEHDDEGKSPEPAPRRELRRWKKEEEDTVSQLERLALRRTMDSASNPFTSVDETELAPLKESSSDESEKVGKARKPETGASVDLGVVINPIKSNRSPLVSGRVSSVPSMQLNSSRSEVAESPTPLNRKSRRTEEFETTGDEFPNEGRTPIDLNPDDTSEWRTSIESQYSPHKPPLPSRSFESPSPRQRRRVSDGSSPTTPSNQKRSPPGQRMAKERSQSYSFSSSNSVSGDPVRETPSLNESSSLMSSGTKVTPMTRGSTTKGSIFIPRISSARTESVSSYMPTDPDNMSEMSDGTFSDIQ